MKTTQLILVGGFLGAGKTTLLWQTAQRLVSRGLRVGLITNDQAPELVDTTLLTRNNLPVAEVSGSCFCCNFSGFVDAIHKMRQEADADVIIAEPVGSCADLSATLMQPLKLYYDRELRVAPLSVMVDPQRMNALLHDGPTDLHPDAAYIVKKQLEESDMILINKVDLLPAEELEQMKALTGNAFPAAKVFAVSAQTGAGVDTWMDEVTTRKDAGKRLVEMDYDRYANGEAVLGWLNGTLFLQGEPTEWDSFIRSFLTNLSEAFDRAELPVGHVKVIAENGELFLTGNITGKADTISLRGSAGQGETLKLIVNARVETSPENLDRLVRQTLDTLVAGRYAAEVIAWKYLQPGRPQPTHRFSEVV